jgi:eukaryotic-like serine/threonine-protein kinase
MEYRKRNFSRSRIGQQLGNYRLVHLLGRGSFADVYLGEHIHLNTQEAIKVLDMRLTNDDMEDFLKEARTIAHLKHPSIIQIFEFGVENNTPFLVMDYAPNGTLRSHFPRGSRFSPEDIQPFVMQIASALQHAHDEKLIHRDIKPENMLLGSNDEVLLADFGLAIVAHSSRTQSMQGVAGTVAYMAPEQLRGMPVKASDQYALAAVIYEWLTGKSLFQGSFVEVATHHTHTPPPSLIAQVPTISPMVESAVLKALSKDPTQRFASVQEFADVLAQCINNEGPYPIQPGEETFSSNTEPLLSMQEVDVLPLQETTITTYHGHAAPVNAVSWSPGNRQEVAHYRSHIASGSDDGTVQIWDAMTGHKISSYRGHSGGVSAIAWSPDGKWIASAGIDCTVQVWAADSMRKVYAYSRHSDKVTALAWSPASISSSAGHSFLIASASADSTVQIWDAATGHRFFIYRGHVNPVHAVTWSPDGRYIASAGEDMAVQVWKVPMKDVPTGKIFLISHNSSNTILTVAWSPDGKYIASGGADQMVEVWEVATGGTICIYHGHKFTVSAVDWSPDGTRIASASFDRTVQIWDATTGENAVSYPGHSSWVYAVAWAQNGQYIASASSDKTVQVWLPV